MRNTPPHEEYDYSLPRPFWPRVAKWLALPAAAWLLFSLLWPKPLTFQVVNGDSESPVFVERVREPDAWAAPMGVLMGGWKGEPPSLGGGASIGPLLIPKKIYVRWFNFSQQRFFEVMVEDDAMPAKAARIVAEKPSAAKYTLYITTAIADSGKVQIWLIGADGNFNSPDWNFTELLGEAQGKEVLKISVYNGMTKELRVEGRIPQEPLPPHPDTQPPRASQTFW